MSLLYLLTVYVYSREDWITKPYWTADVTPVVYTGTKTNKTKKRRSRRSEHSQIALYTVYIGYYLPWFFF